MTRDDRQDQEQDDCLWLFQRKDAPRAFGFVVRSIDNNRLHTNVGMQTMEDEMGLRERSAWRGQRSNAKDRGIGFHFEYEEWIKWWEDHIGPNWFQKRGCKKGQYCMARFHDKGDYVVGNVKCILVGDNHEEALLRRDSRFGSTNRHLTEDEIRTMYLEPELCKVLARKFGVAASVVERIKRGEKHRKITDELGKPGRVPHWRMSPRRMRLDELKRRLGRDDIWIKRL